MHNLNLLYVCVHLVFFLLDAPRWDEAYPMKAAGTEGTSADVTCVVHSLPTATFHWLKNGNNLTSSADYTISSQGNVSTLRINSVRSSDYGTFECSANNYVGGRNLSIQFSTPGKICFLDCLYTQIQYVLAT
jgi:hypothetical protein